MLEIIIEPIECYNDDTQEFYTVPGATLHLEHSLISVSKWESKWHKPFMESTNNLTREETIDYIKCMTMNTNKIDERCYLGLNAENTQKILDYIKDPMTATWFGEDKKVKKQPSRMNKQVITSELIYYWMVALQIPFECQKWHLNRLLTLIRVCNAKNEEQNPNKPKMSKRELMSRNAALNAQRKAKMHTKG